MSFSGGHFYLVGYPKRWLVAASTMVKDEVYFWRENLLKKLKSKCKQFHGSSCSVEKLG